MAATHLARHSGRSTAYRRFELPTGSLLGLVVGALALSAVLTMLNGGRVKLGALSGVAARPLPETRPATMTYREPAADGRPVSLATAIASANAFAGRGDLALSGGTHQSAVGQGDGAVYALRSSAEPVADEFRVDARTGEVLQATRLVTGPAAVGGSPLTSLDAEPRAERLVADRFLGFGALSLVDRAVASAPNGDRLYTFKWAMLAPESGAELPTSVAVTLSAATGEMVWYVAQRESVTVETRPRVERESAVTVAAELAERSGIWESQTPQSTRLQVVHDDDNRQVLAWAISFAGRRDQPVGRSSLRLLVRADSGELLDLH